MKTAFIIIFLALSKLSFGCVGDSLLVQQPLKMVEEVEPTKPFSIGADWLLETKTELINGISYSPTLEFNVARPNGFVFQIQTGALPIITGLKIDKTQPAAGFSVSYKF